MVTEILLFLILKQWWIDFPIVMQKNCNSLRTVPCFVSAHTFCASCKARFNYHMCVGVDIDAINYATKYTTKMKTKFSCCDQIKFNKPVLKTGTPE